MAFARISILLSLIYIYSVHCAGIQRKLTPRIRPIDNNHPFFKCNKCMEPSICMTKSTDPCRLSEVTLRDRELQYIWCQSIDKCPKNLVINGTQQNRFDCKCCLECKTECYDGCHNHDPKAPDMCPFLETVFYHPVEDTWIDMVEVPDDADDTDDTDEEVSENWQNKVGRFFKELFIGREGWHPSDQPTNATTTRSPTNENIEWI